MVASTRSLSPKKRQWLGSLSMSNNKSSHRVKQHPRLLQCRANEGSAGETDCESLDPDDDVDMDDANTEPKTFSIDIQRCPTKKHANEQRAEISVKVPGFSDVEAMRDVEKVVSDTFSIGAHRFCLWVFPNGNPNEAQYKGRVLSVYLVLTDLSRRAPDWLTCAVFSLQRRLKWHSCLTDNKFHKHLNNWGVHSLGSLSMLRDPQQGFLTSSTGDQTQPDTLTVSAQVRLMSITFRVVFETIFPVVSGQALRPRKLLTCDKSQQERPLFGHLLCDGVDIDAYSFCQIYVENSSPAPVNRLEYVGKVRVSGASLSESTEMQAKHHSGKLAPSALYEAVARHTGWSCAQLEMYREEIAPIVVSELIPYHTSAEKAGLKTADILIFCVQPQALHGPSPRSVLDPVYELLLERYAESRELFDLMDWRHPR
ncbi:TRAF-like [Phytophthora cactorum]|nr:TRAF-like [Phytophthora cactorum]